MPPSRPLQTACRMDLYSQAEMLGILTQFVDGQGQTRVTDEAALKIIIDALPARSTRRLIEGPVVIRSDRPSEIKLSPAAKLPLHWQITAGRRAIAAGEADSRTVRWPGDLLPGVYRLQLTDAASVEEEAPLIVAPPKACGGDFDRDWLLAAQLYGVRSSRNW